jgi:hypothetical protein
MGFALFLLEWWKKYLLFYMVRTGIFLGNGRKDLLSV